MRLLITGAAGFMGRNALLALPHSWQVAALYRPGNTDFLDFAESHQLHHIQPVACDLTDVCQIEQAVDQVGGRFDSYIPLARNTSIPLSIGQPVTDQAAKTSGL